MNSKRITRVRRNSALLAFLFAPSIASVLCSMSVADEPPPIVIVHGAWGGSHHWTAVEQRLRIEHGRAVFRVSLTGLGPKTHLASRDVTLQTHIADVTNLIKFEKLEKVVLIGHSYGGAVALGAADVMPESVSKLFLLDSHLLEDGESFMTHHPKRLEQVTKRAKEAGDGWLIPVDWPNPMLDSPHPLSTLTEPLKLKNEKREKIPSHFWLFADGKPEDQDERFRYLKRAKEKGWKTKVFPWGHNPQRAQPNKLTDALEASLD